MRSLLLLVSSLTAAAPAREPVESVRAIALAVQAFTDSVARARPLSASWGVEPAAMRDSRLGRYRAWVGALDSLDRAALTGTPEFLLYRGLREGLARQIAAASCRDEAWNVSPLGGPHLALSGTIATMARDSVAFAQNAPRLRSFPDAIRDHVDQLEQGIGDGFVASRDNVDRVVDQLDVLLGQLAATTSALTHDTLAAAVIGYRSYLTDAYKSRARTDGSLSGLPGGAECYRAKVRFTSGIDTPAESLATIAAERIRSTDAELAPILRRLVGDVPLAEAKRRIRTEARFLHTSREEMLAGAKEIEARLTPAVSRLFRNPPSAPLLIEPTPAVRERSDPPGRYSGPSTPGGPGTFYLNTWRPDSAPRWNLPIAVAHEGAPGHHFERTYPRSVEVPPAARSYGIGSYIEGWGMYAEELAVRESGVLDEDLYRAGFLLHFLDGWNGLELDIRMHLEGWTREQVIARTMEVTGKSRTIASNYADRHAATPGQLASYMIGYLAIREMRDEMQRSRGSAFDVRDFHERYLEAGPLPLTVVRERMRAP